MEIVLKYFPELSENQRLQLGKLEALYREWNSQINVISRKDIANLYLRHVLHSLGIARVQPFMPGSAVLDAGTGGGFPGVPLAILFPETTFCLVDSIGKKIQVVNAVVDALKLQNVQTAHTRVETVRGKFDFVVSRAVTHLPQLVRWVSPCLKKESRHELKNGILCLKGGDVAAELQNVPQTVMYPLARYFQEDFFETKWVVYVPVM